MFRKYKIEYNPKIDFKIIHYQNPKYNIEKDYFELKDIFRKKAGYKSEQGKWFKKTMDIYNHLVSSDVFDIETYSHVKDLFEIDYKKDILEDIIIHCKNLNEDNYLFVILEALKEIIYKKPFLDFSERIGFLLFNAMLKKNNFIPIMCPPIYCDFIVKEIQTGITTASLFDLFSVFEDPSKYYLEKFLPMKKVDVIDIVMKNKNELINCFNVKSLWLYGSFVIDDATDYSDIDLLIEYKIDANLEHQTKVREYLRKILGRSIDLHNRNEAKLQFATNSRVREENIFYDVK